MLVSNVQNVQKWVQNICMYAVCVWSSVLYVLPTPPILPSSLSPGQPSVGGSPHEPDPAQGLLLFLFSYDCCLFGGQLWVFGKVAGDAFLFCIVLCSNTKLLETYNGTYSKILDPDNWLSIVFSSGCSARQFCTLCMASSWNCFWRQPYFYNFWFRNVCD